MKRILLSVVVAALSLGFIATPVEAKRLGGGSSQGMKRQLPAKPAPDAVPSQQAAKQSTPPAAPTAAAPVTPPKRSWLGPIAGLAAGLGIAALMSHLGFGAEFGNIIMLVLLAIAAVMLVRFVMRRFMKPSPGLQLAGAGNTGGGWNVARTAEPGFGSAPLPVQNAAPSVPAGFDTTGFERAAKLIFIRMQAANDAADLNDLRQFSTPEMFAAFRLDLQDRQSAPQRTDVLQVEAHILDVTEEGGQQIVSVRFDGLLREEPHAPATPFDEVWHLVRPKDGSREWAIAGIEQTVH